MRKILHPVYPLPRITSRKTPRGVYILFFVYKEKYQKKNFLRETTFRLWEIRFDRARFRGAEKLGGILCILPVHETGQQKAVTHVVCNGFLPGTEYKKERFG